MNITLILVLVITVPIILGQACIIRYYRKEATKDRITNNCYEATIRSLNASVAYFKDQNNRLRSLLNLSVDTKVQPSSKVIVLDRHKRTVKNPLTPRTL